VNFGFPYSLLSRFPPLYSGAIISTPAFSSPAFWCREFHSRVFQPCIFDALAFSTPAFSVATALFRLFNDHWTRRQRDTSTTLLFLYMQGVARTGRNTTGPPCSRGAIIRLKAAWRHLCNCSLLTLVQQVDGKLTAVTVYRHSWFGDRDFSFLHSREISWNKTMARADIARKQQTLAANRLGVADSLLLARSGRPSTRGYKSVVRPCGYSYRIMARDYALCAPFAWLAKLQNRGEVLPSPTASCSLL